MADEMKKVGIEFKADGSVNFKKSLREVTSAIQESRAEYKLAQSQWTSCTNSAEKLRAEQKYDAEQVKLYTEKVNGLKEALKQQEEKEGTSAAAISKTKENLAKAETSLNNYKKGLENVNNRLNTGAATLEMYSEKMEKVGKKTTEVGDGLSKNVSVPLTAVATAAVTSANTIDEGYEAIIKKTGSVGDETEKMKKIFDEVYPQSAADAVDVGNAIGDVSARFDVHGKTLEKMSVKFLQFAKVNNVDVSDSVQKVSRYMGDASIPTNKYGQVLDQLTKASQKSGISMDVLTEHLTRYGAPMRALGFTTQESIAMFSGWEKAGVNTEVAFSGMKKSISNWGKEGKDSRVEFKKTMEEIKKAPNIADATTKAIDVFGTKAGPDLADAIRGGRFEYSNLLGEIQKSNGTLKTTAAQVSSPADKMKKALHSAQEPIAGLGSTLLDTLLPALKSLSKIANSLNDSWKNMSGGQKKLISDLLLLGIALGPVLSGAGRVATGISAITKGVSKFLEFSPKLLGLIKNSRIVLNALIPVIRSLNAAMAANPIGATIVIIGLVIAALVLLWTHCKGFRDFVKGALSLIVNAFKTDVEIVKKAFKAITTALDTAKKGITSFASHTKDTIGKGFKEGADTAKKALGNGLKSAYDSANNLTNGGLQKTLDLTKSHLLDIHNAYVRSGEGIKGVVSGGMAGIKDIMRDQLTVMNTITGGKLGDILGHFKDLISKAHHVISDGLANIKSLFDFDWKLPELKMPHFTASGKFSLNPISVPTFSLKWFKDGGVLNKPTIFGSVGNTALGMGEAGPEAILPITVLKKYIAEENAKSNANLLMMLKEALGDVMYLSIVKAFNACNPTMVLDDEKVGEIMTEFFRKEVLT